MCYPARDRPPSHMTAELKTVCTWIASVCGLALAWYVMVAANTALFDSLRLNSYAQLIYLPAALRIIYPLVFGRAGIAGVILGSLLGFLYEDTDGNLDRVLLAILSAVAPLIGIKLFTRIYRIRADLADLMPKHLLTLSLLCAASNALVLNLCLAATDHVFQPLTQVATIFVGDFTGSIIVLYCTGLLLTFFISRRRT